MKIAFDPPTIIGALAEERRDIPTELLRRFRRLEPGIAFLPFLVERRHLKNTTACMQLMDVRALAVFGKLQREIVRHLPALTPAAQSAKAVDTVVRRGKRFIGHHVLTEVCRAWLRAQKLPTSTADALAAYASGRGRRPSFAPRSRKELMGLFYQTAVELLTGAEK